MNRKRIEAHLNRAIEQLIPDLFESLANTPIRKMEKHDYITHQEVAEQPNYQQQLITVSVSIMLIICILINWFQFISVDSIVSIDVNPSIEITTNKWNKVLGIKAFNYDGDIILDPINLKNTDLSIALNAIFDSMFQMDFIGKDSNVILVSVHNKNATSAAKLHELIIKDISSCLRKKEVKPMILQQTILSHNKPKKLAKEYNISLGKLNFLKELIALDSSLKIEELAPLSLQELLQVAKEKEIDLHELVDYEDSYLNKESNINNYENKQENEGVDEDDEDNEKNIINSVFMSIDNIPHPILHNNGVEDLDDDDCDEDDSVVDDDDDCDEDDSVVDDDDDSDEDDSVVDDDD
jgi:hypothetical protein